jgi:hypothetical protein
MSSRASVLVDEPGRELVRPDGRRRSVRVVGRMVDARDPNTSGEDDPEDRVGRLVRPVAVAGERGSAPRDTARDHHHTCERAVRNAIVYAVPRADGRRPRRRRCAKRVRPKMT